LIHPQRLEEVFPEVGGIFAARNALNELSEQDEIGIGVLPCRAGDPGCAVLQGEFNDFDPAPALFGYQRHRGVAGQSAAMTQEEADGYSLIEPQLWETFINWGVERDLPGLYQPQHGCGRQDLGTTRKSKQRVRPHRQQFAGIGESATRQYGRLPQALRQRR